MRTTAVNVQSAISFFTLLFFLFISSPPNSNTTYSKFPLFNCPPYIREYILTNSYNKTTDDSDAIEITNVCPKLKVVVYVM